MKYIIEIEKKNSQSKSYEEDFKSDKQAILAGQKLNNFPSINNIKIINFKTLETVYSANKNSLLITDKDEQQVIRFLDIYDGKTKDELRKKTHLRESSLTNVLARLKNKDLIYFDKENGWLLK